MTLAFKKFLKVIELKIYIKYLVEKSSANKLILIIGLILSIKPIMNISLKMVILTKWAKFINFKKNFSRSKCLIK